MEERGLLRPDEAARWLSISRTKCYQLLAAGRIPSVIVGSSRRVPVEQLRRLIAEKVEQPLSRL